jgi:hypothetical protein
MQIRLSVNLGEYKKKLNKIQKEQLPFAYMRALNDTAYEGMQSARKAMISSFSTPISPYFKSGVIYQKASYPKGGRGKADVEKMFALVGIEDYGDKGQPRYDQLKPHIFGGTRGQKKTERNILGPGRFFYPGRNTGRNKLGNIPTAQIVKANMDLGSSPLPGQQTKNKRKQYFLIQNKKQRLMIMRRPTKQAQPIPFMVEGRKPTYTKRYDFYGVVDKVISRRFNKNMDFRLAEAMKKAKR